MSEQPTRADIEEALGSFLNTWEEKVLSWAARQYLASLDASAPSPSIEDVLIENRERFLDAIADTGSPKDGTREPFPYSVAMVGNGPTYPVPQEDDITPEAIAQLRTQADKAMDKGDWRQIDPPPVPIIDEMDPRHVSNPGTGAHVLDHRSPPVVSEEMLDRAIEGYWCNATENTHRKALRRALQAALAPLLEQNARLKARIEHWEKTAAHHWSARQKLQRELNVITELYNAGRGAEERVKELEEGWHLCHAEGKLTDPIAVHINMLRGTIAKPSVKNIIHLYGREALLKELCEDAQTKNALPQPLS